MAQTLRAASGLMAVLGISRVTDITRLDRLGLPVYASVRPRGRTLRVHAGKGVVPADARIGALMEALEFAVAEQDSARPPEARLSVKALERQWPDGLRLDNFAPRLGADMPATRRLAAVRCEDIAGGAPVWLPAELVCVPGPAEAGAPLFGWTTNGLASGNSLDEATLHALLEVLERDALALDKARSAAARVDEATLPAPFDAWAAAWRRLGIELIVHAVPNGFGLPCFQAFLHEPGSLDVNLAAGSGLHFDRGMALARAVCEAAQSRLSTLHGGRDDLTRFYAKYSHGGPPAGAEDRLVAALRDPGRDIRFDALPSLPVSTPGLALQALLAQLAGLGFRQVYRRCMDLPGGVLAQAGLHVVKLVVPRCEAVLTADVRMGPRLRARVLGHG